MDNKVIEEFRFQIIMVTLLTFGLVKTNDLLNIYIKNGFYIIVERVLD